MHDLKRVETYSYTNILLKYICHISLTNETFQAFQISSCRKSSKLSFNITFVK